MKDYTIGGIVKDGVKIWYVDSKEGLTSLPIFMPVNKNNKMNN